MRVDFSVPSSLPTATASPECATLTTIQGPGFGCRRDNQWQCRDGRCIDARRRCDLNRDCNDASDEDSDTCTSVPTLIMNVGDTVLARMKHKENYHGVRFLMCSNDSCSCLTVSGEGSSGLLALVAKAECNSKGADCLHTVHAEFSQNEDFPTAILVFKLRRTESMLLLRIQGYKASYVPIDRDYNVLSIRPDYWLSDMPVEFKAESVRNDDQG
ncbi:uncharacterized protein LOC117646772 isoform X3 [Thrips palmi]|uniref:Uncharacterized protein LOC117646772 isoform X3 n=1 Tax=Thrips palmi TaxID=161013 RepID=A0A6P8ZPC5_THRPL|nr:uncharacterized protein LOC117646772 isoform X3 [Thrips palmi]